MNRTSASDNKHGDTTAQRWQDNNNGTGVQRACRTLTLTNGVASGKSEANQTAYADMSLHQGA